MGLPIGTGPYKLVELRSDQLYRFEANASYFMGRPLVDELVMPIITDPNAAFTALRTGEIDVAIRDVPPELRDEFSRLPGIKTIRTNPLAVMELRMNSRWFDRPGSEVSPDGRSPSLVDTVCAGGHPWGR
jgi:peptide/nickel transport system substrate-binding protein